MSNESLSTENPKVPTTKFAYLSALRQTVRASGGIDLATVTLFISEIEHHFDLLCEDLRDQGVQDEKLEARAVSLMEDPRRLAEDFVHADSIARKESPLCWRHVATTSWIQFLQLKATLALGIALGLICALLALFLGSVVPASWQELWLVPAVAMSVFAVTACAALFIQGGILLLSPARAFLCAGIFSAGALIATWCAESISTIDWGMAQQGAYFVLLVTISLSSSIAFAGLFFSHLKAQYAYVRVAFVAMLAAHLASTLAVLGLAGRHHGLLFCLYATFGIIVVLAARRYVCVTLGQAPESITKVYTR